MNGFTESVVARAALAWLESTSWSVRNGTYIAHCEDGRELLAEIAVGEVDATQAARS